MTAVDIADRLERVVRSHVEGSIPPDPSGELAAKSLADLLLVYGNWRGRFVSRGRRRVHLSREFVAELPGSVHEVAVREVCREIEDGADLTPRLSKRVETAYVPRSSKTGGLDADIDAMLAHDGLHHLHLGAHGDSKFVERTGDLLFVAFQENDAYLIGVYPHGAWGRRELLERIARNWPEAGLIHELRSVIGLTQTVTDEERWQLMKAGVSVLIEIDGKVYALLGQTTARTPMIVTQRVNAFMWELRDLRSNGVEDRLRRAGADPTLYWTPAVRNEQAGLESADGFLPLGQLA